MTVRRRSWTPRATDLAPAIAWLRAHQVPVSVLCHAFGLSANYIGVLASRGRQARVSRPEAVPGNPERSRPHPRIEVADWVRPDASRVRDLHERLETLVDQYRTLQHFTEAMARLDDLRPAFGRPSSVAMLRLLARWHYHKSWFATHARHFGQAIGDARRAQAIFQALYQSTGQRDDLHGLSETCLVRSHAHLYLGQPAVSLRVLDTYRRAVEVTSAALGSEYYRQLGTAYALETDDPPDYAVRILRRVPEEMARCGEATSERALRFAGRQADLLSAHVDIEALEGVRQLALEVAPNSLEAAIAVNYCAAAKLTQPSETPHVVQALEMLEQNRVVSARFVLQQLVGFLLERTPALRLEAPLRRRWVRQVWYLGSHRAG